MNLSNRGMEALLALRHNDHFLVFMEEMEEQVFRTLHASVNTAPPMRTDATAYARGVCEVWAFMRAASENKRVSAIQPARGDLTPHGQDEDVSAFEAAVAKVVNEMREKEATASPPTPPTPPAPPSKPSK